ncbi:hypothetical protein D9M68_981970 [compost metagenome]
MGTELVHHARSQRGLRADHRERNAVGLRPFAQRHLVRHGQVGQFGVPCGAGVAGCHEDLAHTLGLFQFPRQRVLAATAANHQDFQTYLQNSITVSERNAPSRTRRNRLCRAASR